MNPKKGVKSNRGEPEGEGRREGEEREREEGGIPSCTLTILANLFSISAGC